MSEHDTSKPRVLRGWALLSSLDPLSPEDICVSRAPEKYPHKRHLSEDVVLQRAADYDAQQAEMAKLRRVLENIGSHFQYLMDVPLQEEIGATEERDPHMRVMRTIEYMNALRAEHDREIEEALEWMFKHDDEFTPEELTMAWNIEKQYILAEYRASKQAPETPRDHRPWCMADKTEFTGDFHIAKKCTCERRAGTATDTGQRRREGPYKRTDIYATAPDGSQQLVSGNGCVEDQRTGPKDRRDSIDRRKHHWPYASVEHPMRRDNKERRWKPERRATDAPPQPAMKVSSVRSGAWDDPETWDGDVKQASEVVINSGHTVTEDTQPAMTDEQAAEVIARFLHDGMHTQPNDFQAALRHAVARLRGK